MNLNRRQLICSGAAAGFALPGLNTFAEVTEKQKEDPHFLLVLFFPGGMDATLTFDARTRALNSAGLHVNPLTSEPEVWTDENGNSTLVTELTKPLWKHRSDFSVVNGVVMMPEFDGHPNNVSYFMTGQGFGGDSFFPQINNTAVRTSKVLDCVRMGDGMLLTQFTNGSNIVPFGAKSLGQFIEKLDHIPSVEQKPELWKFLNERASRLGANKNSIFGNGADKLHGSLGEIPSLVSQLKELGGGLEHELETIANMNVFAGLVKSGIAQSGLYVFDTDLSETQNLDAHANSDAMQQPRIIGELMTELDSIFTFLKTTPYDDSRSLFDVTTVVVGSEFSRSMRQKSFGPDPVNIDIENSGTDHNSLTNTVLLAGKGIRGGQILGASDIASPDEIISQAHKEWDAHGESIMGRPFDFGTWRPRSDLPESYEAANYVNFGSVMNTVYGNFGIPTEDHWTLGRNGPTAKALEPLLI